jgi:hypothetical protein
MSELSEETTQFPSIRLLADFLNGDEDAAKAIFDRYVMGLMKVAKVRISPVLQSRIDPDDIVQSACGSFFRKAREDGLVLTRSGELWRILASYTLNKTRSYIEKELAAKRDPRLECGDAFWQAAVEREPSPEEATILIDELTNFMRQLTPRDRRILELRLRGAAVEEICDELAEPSPDSNLPAQCVAQATVRRVLRECKFQLERRLLEE